jgi:HK97 family phage major capsid protein
MSDAANKGNIITLEESDLYKILDETNRALDHCDKAIPELEKRDLAQAEELTELRGILESLREDYKKLDERQAKGSKHWEAETPFATRAFRSMGDVFTAAYVGFKTSYRVVPEGYTRAADQTGDNDSKGGVLVPELTYDQIGYILGERSLARLLCTVVPMTSDYMKAPILDTGPVVYYVGQGDAPTASSLAFSKVDLNVKTLMAINVISGELTEDSLPAYGPFWAQVFTDAFALKESKAVFSETATDSNCAFTGIVQAVEAASGGVQHIEYLGGSSTSHKTNFSEVAFADINALQNAPHENAIADGAVWVMNRAAWRYIQGLKDNNGNPILSTDYVNFNVSGGGRPDPRVARGTALMGDPVYLTRAMPSTTSTAGKALVIYGNPKYHFFGDRKQMAIAWSDEAAFTSGARVMRCRERYAAANGIVDAFAILKNAAS